MDLVFIISIAANIVTIPIVIYFVLKKVRQLQSDNPSDQRRENKDSIFKVLSETSNDIFFIGDSLIERCHWHELLGNNDIRNRGIGGDTISGLTSRLDTILERNPSKIFIMIGINDYLQGRSSDVLIPQYQKMIDQIQKTSNAQLYLHSILPPNRALWLYSKVSSTDVEKFNKGISEIDQTTYVDLWPVMVDANNELKSEYTTDGLHLNGAAYQKWAEIIAGQV